MYRWRTYVPVGARRSRDAKAVLKRLKKGTVPSPITVSGRAMVNTFWGKAWCQNLERYSDYSNRLPRGRTYLRNGSIVHLEVASGLITAFVSGSSLYRVRIQIDPVPKGRWKSLCRDCAGGIDSLVELLQARFSTAVMERMCEPGRGLCPSPSEIRLGCSCPDWATMCKHVAAVLYGVGARFDKDPSLLFKLRGVHADDLLVAAGKGVARIDTARPSDRVLQTDSLSELFGLDIRERRSRAAGSRKVETVPRGRSRS